MRIGSWIVQSCEHHIRHFTIFPETNSSRGINASRSSRTGDRVKPSKQMHEKISSNAGAVVAIIAPAKEALCIPGALGRVALKAGPIASFRTGIERNRIFPRSDGIVAIEPSLD